MTVLLCTDYDIVLPFINVWNVHIFSTSYFLFEYVYVSF